MSAIDDKVQELAESGFEVGAALTSQGSDDAGRLWQQFENAWLMAEVDGGVWVVWGATLAAYNESGGIGTHGFPINSQVASGRDDVTSWDFETGSRIYEFNGDSGISFVLSPPLLTRYDELGGPTGSLGGLAANEQFDGTLWWAPFEHGDALYNSAGTVFHLSPLVARGYTDNGGPVGTLGVPTSDWFSGDQGDGAEGATFAGGTLWVQPDGTTFMQSAATPVVGDGTWPRFTTGAEADAWFAANTGQSTFIEWFTATQSKVGAWSQHAIAGSAQGAFLNAWSNLTGTIDRNYVTLPDFLTLVSVMINETGGTFVPLSERVGTKAHPGIAYAYDPDPGIPKASYNTAPNKTAFALFNDATFLGAHGALPLAASVTNTKDQRWAHTAYPVADFPTSTDPAVSGIILEADFYKFRGRGVIQTTWRSGYLSLVQYIQGYAGTDPVLLQYKAAWTGLAPDDVCSTSSNADWDALFRNSNFELAREAVRRHNAAGGHYYWLSEDRAVIDGAVGMNGSVRHAGKTVSGRSGYGDTLRDRVVQMLSALGL